MKTKTINVVVLDDGDVKITSFSGEDACREAIHEFIRVVTHLADEQLTTEELGEIVGRLYYEDDDGVVEVRIVDSQ